MLHSVDVLHSVPTFLELWVVDLTMLVILNYTTMLVTMLVFGMHVFIIMSFMVYKLSQNGITFMALII